MMPPLPALNDPSLHQALSDLAPGLSLGDAQRLAGGRTNHVWRIGPVVLKCHEPAGATPLFPNDPQAETTALRLFAPRGIAPHLLAEGAGWLICRYLPRQETPPTPASVAHLLHRLHSHPVPGAPFRILPNGSAAILAHARSFAPAGLPAPPDDPQVPPVAPRPIHGDAVPGNILSTPSGPVLIDWQCPGMGDPAEDLATLLSPAMMWLYTGEKQDEGWREALLHAYPDRATADRTRTLLPLFRWRIMAHCAWKASRGDADYAPALRIELETP